MLYNHILWRRIIFKESWKYTCGTKYYCTTLNVLTILLSSNFRFTATKAFKLMLNEINDLAGQHEVWTLNIHYRGLYSSQYWYNQTYKKLPFLGLFYKKKNLDLTSLVWLQIPKAINTSNNHSFLPLTTTNFNLINVGFHENGNFCYKRRLFIKNTTPLILIKNYFTPV